MCLRVRRVVKAVMVGPGWVVGEWRFGVRRYDKELEQSVRGRTKSPSTVGIRTFFEEVVTVPKEMVVGRDFRDEF